MKAKSNKTLHELTPMDTSVNTILFNRLSWYLKENDERLDRDLFKAVLSACRLVEGGEKIGSACSLAAIGAEDTHFETKELRPYVKAVMQIALPVIEAFHEQERKNREHQELVAKKLKELGELVRNSSPDEEFLSVERSTLLMLYSELKQRKWL